ncbi:MAG: SDR family NAD(P)-dependent oxidoreductase [Sphingobacterium sp.]|nr:SDR family NAD(P)-dependent oxidoreductase [Sphingobacterium sp.]
MEYQRPAARQARARRPGRCTIACAVVTGAAGAIGTGVATGLLEAGCHVVVTDLPGAALESLAAELDAAFPGRAVGVPMDVTRRRVGGGRVRVRRAHVGRRRPGHRQRRHRARGGADGRWTSRRSASWSASTSKGRCWSCAECGRHFARQQTGGDIVLVSTKNVFAPGARFGAYSATKAAAHQLARIASLELADLDVRVNMVSPGCGVLARRAAIGPVGGGGAGPDEGAGPGRGRASRSTTARATC